MSLAQMSVYGAVMIVFTVVVRALLFYKLPKRTFPILWCFILARLLIPFSLPCVFSAYSFLTRGSVPKETRENMTAPLLTDFYPAYSESAADISASPLNSRTEVLSVDMHMVFWIAGVLICFVLFAIPYIGCLMKFRESLPADNECIREWLAEHKTLRRISVRCSDRISSPLTYGVFRPVILLPKKFGEIETDDLKFVLTHEYVHIRRFDAVFKLVLTAAVCVHWFNPMVWVMLFIANRDIEISCDEAVVKMLGECEKQSYAMTLIRMEEIKGGLMPLNNFSKNAVKERIVAIMNFKKASVLTIIASACLIVGTTTVFATSAEAPKEDVSQSEATSADETKINGVFSNSVENSKSEPVKEEVVSAEDWLKQPHSAPLADVNVEIDPKGDYSLIPAEQGTEIYAMDDGEVVYAEYGGYMGKVVVIKHTGDIYTYYCHLDLEHGLAVNVGENVRAGQCVGYVGNSGNTVCHGLGFYCGNEMLNFDISRGVSTFEDEKGLVENTDDYDYIKVVDGGYITGRYK